MLICSQPCRSMNQLQWAPNRIPFYADLFSAMLFNDAATVHSREMDWKNAMKVMRDNIRIRDEMLYISIYIVRKMIFLYVLFIMKI